MALKKRGILPIQTEWHLSTLNFSYFYKEIAVHFVDSDFFAVIQLFHLYEQLKHRIVRRV